MRHADSEHGMAYVTSKMVNTKNGAKRKVWLAKWTPISRKETEKSFEYKREARAHADFMARTAEKVAPEPDEASAIQRTFDDVASEFLKNLHKPTDGSDPRGEQTIRTYAHYLDKVPGAYFQIKGGAVQHISDSDVEEIRDRAVRECNSRRAAEEVLRLTKAVLVFAKDRKYLSNPPGQFVKIAKSKRREIEADIATRDDVYKPEDLKRILEAADALAVDDNKQRRRAWAIYRPLAYLLIGTGVRISEARGLPRKYLDVRDGVMKIRQKATEKGKIDVPKSGLGVRDLRLPPECIEPLRSLLHVHERDLLFSTANGTPMGYHNLYNRMLKVLIEKAEVPNYGFHGFRHAYASRLIANNVDFKTLQTWMGHHDASFTMQVYGHLMRDADREAEIMAKISLA